MPDMEVCRQRGDFEGQEDGMQRELLVAPFTINLYAREKN
jgi:hypothetical protein